MTVLPPSTNDISANSLSPHDQGELAVIICHFNPCGYAAPVRNLRETLRWLRHAELPVYAAEVRCGVSKSVAPILPPSHPHVISAESDFVLFFKENLWNIVARRLPTQYKYVLCLDADVILSVDQLASRVVDRLQISPIVQPFSRAVWTDSKGQPYKDKFSMGYAFAHGLESPHIARLFHPGFALALRRDFWSCGSGFYEREPLGGGNTMFVAAVTGHAADMQASLRAMSTAMVADYEAWAEAAFAWAESRVGYLEGEARHLWHGSTKKRRYLERTALLNGFDPTEDLEADPQLGLLRWSDAARRHKLPLVSGIEDYFSSREEDEWFDSALPA